MVTPARVAWGRPHQQELWDSLDLGKAHSIPQSRRSASLNSALSCKTTFCPDDRDPNRHSVAPWGLCLGAAMVPSRLVFAAQSWAGQSHPGGRCPGSVLHPRSVPPSRARARPRGHSRSCGRCPPRPGGGTRSGTGQVWPQRLPRTRPLRRPRRRLVSCPRRPRKEGATFNLDPQKRRLSSSPSAQSDETPGRAYLLQPQVWRSSTGDGACRGRTGRGPVRGDAAARRALWCAATGQRAKHLHEACASVSKLGLLPRWPGGRGWLPAVTPAARDAVVASLYPARSLRCPPSVPVGRECWCRTGPVEISNAGEDEPSSTDWFISRWMFQIIPELGLVRD